MKFPLSWLNDFVDITCSPQELADLLSLSGTEVEGIETVGDDISGVIAGQITKIEKHPDADRLVVCQVSDGNETHQIVTGAQNVFEGAIVPVSLPGAKLAGGLKIKKGKLRGVASNGMLCSEAELGIAEDAKGIWILPEDTPLGVDLIDYAGVKDTLIEIAILPNRGDCQSVIGLAREIATLLKQPLKQEEPNPSFSAGEPKTQLINQAAALCPFYFGLEITLPDTPEKSPIWLQRRLQLCGIKAISLPVDITNYVLLEYGQPLHAFDAEKLANNTLTIRAATEKESISTLDDQDHTLDAGMLVIADGKAPQAIAGIMGGKESEVTDDTQSILLEAAYFDPTHVRRNGTRLGIRTDSAVRFEKGIDLKQTAKASLRAAELFQQLAKATILETALISQDETHPRSQTNAIPFDHEGINRLLGTQLSEREQLETLARLGFVHNAKDQTVTIPSWRASDIEELPCLAEEIARLIGYDHIPPQLPKGFVPITPEAKEATLATHLKSALKQAGFSEVQTYPMISAGMISQAGLPEQPERLHIQNPLSEEQAIMRPSLLPSLLKVVKFNSTHQQQDLKLYEVGSQYALESNEIVETRMLAAILTGTYQPAAYEASEKTPWSFKTLKTILTTLLSTAKVDSSVQFKTATESWLHPVEALDIYSGEERIGRFGTIHPQIGRTLKLTQPMGYIELNIDAIASLSQNTPKFQPIPKTPSTRRDFAIVAPKSVSYETIMTAIQDKLPKAVTETALFDLFESEDLGPDHKSMAFSFVYQDPEASLSDDEVNTQHKQLMSDVLDKLPDCHIR